MRTLKTCLAGFAASMTLAWLMFAGLHQVERINETTAAPPIFYWHCGPLGHEFEKVCHAER